MLIFIRATKWFQLILINLLCFSFVSSRIRLGPFGIYDDAEISSTTTKSTFLKTTHASPNSFKTLCKNEDGWHFFKDRFAPIFSFVLNLIASAYFLHLLWRKFNLYFKYKRFTFRQATAAERAATRRREAIIEMDPLHFKNQNHCNVSARITKRYSPDSIETVVWIFSRRNFLSNHISLFFYILQSFFYLLQLLYPFVFRETKIDMKQSQDLCIFSLENILNELNRYHLHRVLGYR